MSIFNSFKNAIVKVAAHNGKSRARQELLRMSDRQLEDFGFSKALLLDGVKAWPWRSDEDSSNALPSVAATAQPGQNSRVVNQAVKELSAYSDRELAELGVTRYGIEEAVRYGRPAVEGVFESHKNAA